MKPLQIAFFLIISAFLLGCSISIPDPNQINPLVEKNLSGDGEDKILIIEITGVISQKNKIKNISGKYDINSVAEIKE
ncbi:hypothetical protein KKI24_06665, partial [bacterium]|nr:hypothetical protein [bacterium]